MISQQMQAGIVSVRRGVDTREFVVPSDARLVSTAGGLSEPWLTSEWAYLSEGWQRAWRISLSGGRTSSGAALKGRAIIGLHRAASITSIDSDFNAGNIDFISERSHDRLPGVNHIFTNYC